MTFDMEGKILSKILSDSGKFDLEDIYWALYITASLHQDTTVPQTWYLFCGGLCHSKNSIRLIKFQLEYRKRKKKRYAYCRYKHILILAIFLKFESLHIRKKMYAIRSVQLAKSSPPILLNKNI